MSNTVIVQKERGVALLTLDRPGRFNAFNEQMGQELLATIRDLEKDESSRVLVITGAGSAFCAGADLKGDVGQLLGAVEPEGSRAEGFQRGYRRLVAKIIVGLQNLDIPTIASVPGVAIGIGFDLALACDIRLGSEKARFSEAWVSRGLISAAGGTWLLPRVVGLGRAAELLFSGRFVEAEEAVTMGILNTVVPAEDLAARTMALAESIAKQPPIALKLSKINLYKGLSVDLATALELAGASQAIAVTTSDHLEAMAAWREKRQATFKGR